MDMYDFIDDSQDQQDQAQEHEEAPDIADELQASEPNDAYDDAHFEPEAQEIIPESDLPDTPVNVETFRGWDRDTMIRKINEIRVNPQLKKRLVNVKLPTRAALFKMTLEQLNEVVESINFELGASTFSSSGLVRAAMPLATGAYEKLLCRAGVDASGVAEALNSDPELAVILEELAWKYGKISNWPPEYRLMFSVASTTVRVVSQNKLKGLTNGLGSRDTVEILDQYPDL